MILRVKRSVCEQVRDFESKYDQFASWFMTLRVNTTSLRDGS